MAAKAQTSAYPQNHEQREAALWRAFSKSVRDNIVGESAVQILRVGSTVVFARFLEAEDFGVFRMLLVVGAFAILLGEAGIPDALIQRDELTSEHESTAFWLSIASSAVVAGVLYATAPLVASKMAMPGLCSGVRLLCLPILLGGAAVTADARLRRNLRFGTLALADVLAEVAFIAVALWLLADSKPLWCLPGGLAARYAVRAASLWLAEPCLPSGAPSIRAARDFGRFAASVCGSRLITNISANADYVLVGWLLGGSALGFYSIASELLRFVPDRLHRVAGRVTFPMFCQLRGDGRKMTDAYRNFFANLARIVPTVVVCAAVLAPELLATVFGSKWVSAAMVMRLLAVGFALAGLQVGIGSVYYATDHPSFDIYLHACRLLLIVASIFALSGQGLEGVSAAMSTVEALISVLGLTLACRLVGLGVREFLSAALPGIRVTTLCGITVLAARYIALSAGLEPPLVLLAASIAAALVYLAIEKSNLALMLAVALGRTQTILGAEQEG